MTELIEELINKLAEEIRYRKNLEDKISEIKEALKESFGSSVIKGEDHHYTTTQIYKEIDKIFGDYENENK